MITQINVIFNRQFPQSFLIQKPLWGSLTFFIILFFFVVIYHPLRIHGARSFSLSFTMLVYCFLISLMVLGVAIFIKKQNELSKIDRWSISKELLSIVLFLITIGFSAYFFGFIMERSSSRWNLPTFIDSFSRSVAIGIIPVLFPSILNIRYAFAPDIFQEYKTSKPDRTNTEGEAIIHIQSKAKKETLSFFPDEFLYAEAEGNYVIFHLFKEEKAVDIIIRNSISEIEQQLHAIHCFARIHRAFIVNLKKVSSKKGNSLGYQLKLQGSNKIVPVSRQNTQKFDELTQKIFLSVRP